MTTPITTLQLCTIEIPRSPLVEWLEREMGRKLRREHRHFLAGEPVNCGTLIELFQRGSWVAGRYEWTGRVADPPTLHVGERVVRLTAQHLLRWPT